LIKIAVPNKGRMFKPTLDLLRKAGYELENFNERKLCTESKCKDLNILFMRTQDIGDYVESNIVDLGITGYDIIIEKQSCVKKLIDLNYGFCKLVLAGFKNKNLKNNVKVATKYQNIAEKYLQEKKISAEIINSNGATELNPSLGLADFIIDITSTGNTLKENDLVVYDYILNSSAVLIANKKSLKEKSREIEDLKLAIQSVILAENKSYLIFNISKEILKNIIDQIPCMKAPTVLNTGNKEIVSVQTVVPTKEISKTITKLKGFGTSDILVLDIKRVVV